MRKNLDDFRKDVDQTQKKNAGQFEKDIAKLRNLIAKESAKGIEPLSSKKEPVHTAPRQKGGLELEH